jgi:hypothetical protein
VGELSEVISLGGEEGAAVSCAKAGRARRRRAPTGDSVRMDKCGLQGLYGEIVAEGRVRAGIRRKNSLEVGRDGGGEIHDSLMELVVVGVYVGIDLRLSVRGIAARIPIQFDNHCRENLRGFDNGTSTGD